MKSVFPHILYYFLHTQKRYLNYKVNYKVNLIKAQNQK